MVETSVKDEELPLIFCIFVLKLVAPDLQEFLLSPTVVVDGQQLSRFEVRDTEVLEAEVMDELVRTFVQDVRRACS